MCSSQAVLPFDKFPGADTLLGPEMRSTGEVMGIDKDFNMAYAKAQIAAGQRLPQEVSSLGDAKKSLGDAKSSLDDARSSPGGTNISLFDARATSSSP
jgi:hypothetical protein